MATSLGLWLGCDGEDERASPSICDVAGDALEPIALLPPPTQPLGTKTGVGLDARLFYDLSELTPERLVTDNGRFYIRTEYPDRIDRTAPWSVLVHGLVDEPKTLSVTDIVALSQPQGMHLLECSGNAAGGAFGLMSAAEWTGAPVSDILALVRPQSTRVLVSGFDDHSVPSEGGHSTPGASWIFTTSALAEAGAFLATHMNGEPLPDDHGFPLRLIVPGWYGCCCIKWVNAIELVADDAPATAQMTEFASRTHQNDAPELARDYLPATLDQAAMPVRVEKWREQGAIVYRLIGIMWGGYQPTGALTISFDGGMLHEPVHCAAPSNPRTWTLWSHAWRPPAPGSYLVRMGIADAAIPTRRLDLGWYDRQIDIDEV